MEEGSLDQEREGKQKDKNWTVSVITKSLTRFFFFFSEVNIDPLKLACTSSLSTFTFLTTLTALFSQTCLPQLTIRSKYLCYLVLPLCSCSCVVNRVHIRISGFCLAKYCITVYFPLLPGETLISCDIFFKHCWKQQCLFNNLVWNNEHAGSIFDRW